MSEIDLNKVRETAGLPEQQNELCHVLLYTSSAQYAGECHCNSDKPTTLMVHNLLKRKRLAAVYHLNEDLPPEGFRSKNDAEEAAHSAVNTAYDTAELIFNPDSRWTIEATALMWYVPFLREQLRPVVRTLRGYRNSTGCLALINGAESALREAFRKELQQNYYHLFDRGYYLGQPELVWISGGNSHRINKKGLMGSYAIAGLEEVIEEIENDVNIRADTFLSQAHRHYCNYCRAIEDSVEESSLSNGAQ